MVIYKIINNVNKKIYIGKTIHSLKTRWNKHKYHIKNKKNYHLYNAINKYGIKNFNIVVIDKAETLTELNKKEKDWIIYYKSYDKLFGYNMTMGGDGGKLSNESLKKMIKTKNKTVQEKIRKNGKLYFHPDSWKKLMSYKMKNRIISEETKDKISKALKEGYRTGKIKPVGKPPSRKGIKHTINAKNKISIARKGIKWIEYMSKETIKERMKFLRKKGKENHNYIKIDKDYLYNSLKNNLSKTLKEFSKIVNYSTWTIRERIKEYWDEISYPELKEKIKNDKRDNS